MWSLLLLVRASPLLRSELKGLAGPPGGAAGVMPLPMADDEDVLCEELPVFPVAVCVPPQARTGIWDRQKLCPGAPHAVRMFNPSVKADRSNRRNFRCRRGFICCAEQGEQGGEAPTTSESPVVEGAVDYQAAVMKYEADMKAYREVYPPMPDCTGMTREECMEAEDRAFHKSVSNCEPDADDDDDDGPDAGPALDDDQRSKCYLAGMQNRIAHSGLHYTYDNGTVPEGFWNPFDFLGNDQRDEPTHTATEYYKDPAATMGDGQGDCDDMAIMSHMYCTKMTTSQVEGQEPAMGGSCHIVAGKVEQNGQVGHHAVCVWKDADPPKGTGEAYVLDGTYYQRTDEIAWNDDTGANPDTLIHWNDYTTDDCAGISQESQLTCRGFEPWGGMRVTDTKCYEPNGPECEFRAYGHPDRPQHVDGLGEGEVSDERSVQNSISDYDLKAQRWETHGYNAPMDKHDFDSIETFAEAQYVANSINVMDATMVNKTMVLEEVGSMWVSALFAWNQLRKTNEKRKALKTLSNLMEKGDAYWRREGFLKGRKLRGLLVLLAEVFCEEDPSGTVDCAGSDRVNGLTPGAGSQVAHALALHHRRDAKYPTLEAVCGHVAERLRHLAALTDGKATADWEAAYGAAPSTIDCAPFVTPEQCGEAPQLEGCEGPVGTEDEARLKAAAAFVGLTWDTKSSGMPYWRKLIGATGKWTLAPTSAATAAPTTHKLTTDKALRMQLAAGLAASGITVASLKPFLVERSKTVTVLKSLAAYNRYEQDHWVSQSVWKAALNSAMVLVPLFGANEYGRAYFYYKSAAYRNNQRTALESRTFAAQTILQRSAPCQGDRDAASALWAKVVEYRDQEDDNLLYLAKKDRGYARIHMMSGLTTPFFYCIGPMGSAIRVVSKSLVKLAYGATLGIFRWWKTSGKPSVGVSAVFDLLADIKSPTCQENLAYTLFDLDYHQYQAIANGGWIRKGIFVPSMSVPSFSYAKLWKTPGYMKGWWKRIRQRPELRIAPPEVGFGVATQIECEPAEKCKASAARKSAFKFLRVTGWKNEKNDGGIQKRTAVRNWNKRHPDQKVQLHDIVLSVNHLPSVQDEERYGPRGEVDRFQRWDESDHDMTVRLQIMPGFRTFPTLDVCEGDELRSFELPAGRVSSRMTSSASDGGDELAAPPSPLGSAARKSKQLLAAAGKWASSKTLTFLHGQAYADAKKAPKRDDRCEEACLADPECGAVEVRSTTRVCALFRLNEDATARAPEEGTTCWLRTRLGTEKAAKPPPPPPPEPETKEATRSRALVKDILVEMADYLKRRRVKAEALPAVKLNVAADLGADLDLDPQGLVRIKEVEEGGQAHAAGLKDGDVLVRACSRDVSQATLPDILKKCKGSEKAANFYVVRFARDAAAPARGSRTRDSRDSGAKALAEQERLSRATVRRAGHKLTVHEPRPSTAQRLARDRPPTGSTARVSVTAGGVRREATLRQEALRMRLAREGQRTGTSRQPGIAMTD